MTKLKALLASLLASKTGSVAIQAVAAFAVTFLGELVASGWFDVNHLTDMTLVQKAAVAGVGAAIAVVRSAAAALVSGGYALTLTNAVRYQAAKAKAKRSGSVR